MARGGRLALSLVVAVVLAVAVVELVDALDRDFYKILGVPRDASSKQIKKAYRKLSIEFHPDKNKGNKEAEDKFVDINAAYETLSDPEKRKKYDQLGEEGMNEAARRGGGGGGWDPFADLFGFGGRRNNRGNDVQEGESMKIELMVTLDDLYNGRELRYLHKKQVTCHKCRGTGTDKPEDFQKCTVCGGTGVRTKTQRLGPGFVQQVQTTCDKCGGKGSIAKSTCTHCHGSKVETGVVERFLFVEKGMRNGEEIVFRNSWEETADRTPGDLIFVLRTHPHHMFVRENNDLRMKMEINLLQSLVGFSVQLEHLDGHLFTIARSDVTIPGFVLRIPGEGMPHHEYPSMKGDLYVEFTIKFPVSLSNAQMNTVRELFADAF